MPLWDDDGRINSPFSIDQPVTGITGAAAKRYCRYLSRQLNRRVRLPREWEWRRAARGTDRRKFPWGDEYRDGRAFLADSPRRAEFPYGAPPGSFPGDLSPCGVFDLAGNVREFALPSASDKSLVLVMGGSYQLPPTCAEIDFSQLRLWSDRGDDIGFRCGTPDGIAGRQTASSIERFQTMYGYEPADGIIDSELISQLQDRLARQQG